MTLYDITTSALLLGFSYLWSGSLTIQKDNGEIIQNHLSSFVRNRVPRRQRQLNTLKPFLIRDRETWLKRKIGMKGYRF